MRPHLRVAALFALALIAASETADPDELARQGNAAYRRGDLAAALDLYTRAEGRIQDPGLVACNKASALYHLGNFRAAEIHYRWAGVDAVEPRQTGAARGLANCLVAQGHERGPAVLQEAARLYERCLVDGQLSADMANDVRHNLELAKLLWIQVRTRP